MSCPVIQSQASSAARMNRTFDHLRTGVLKWLGENHQELLDV
jgi:hypothetical protein